MAAGTERAPDSRIQMAYDDARAELARQIASVDELRARVGTILSATTIASGFLAGQAASSKNGLPWQGWLGTAATVGVIAASIYILWPRAWRGARVNVATLFENIADNPQQSLDEYLKDLATFTSGHVEANRKRLSHHYTVFMLSLALVGVSLVGWICALAFE